LLIDPRIFFALVNLFKNLLIKETFENVFLIRSFDFSFSSEAANVDSMLQIESTRIHVISPILMVNPSIVDLIGVIEVE
jgi:hypothetical protein